MINCFPISGKHPFLYVHVPLHLARNSLTFTSLFTCPYLTVHVCCPYLKRSCHAPPPGVALMPRRNTRNDTQVPRIWLVKYMQNLQNISVPAEFFLRTGKSMHAKSPCSLPEKVWQGLNLCMLKYFDYINEHALYIFWLYKWTCTWYHVFILNAPQEIHK